MTKLTPLKMKRIQAGITQEEMAKKLEISRAYYCDKENGKREFSKWEKLLLCRIFKCKQKELFEEG